jgi:hypothetical protein
VGHHPHTSAAPQGFHPAGPPGCYTTIPLAHQLPPAIGGLQNN